MDSKERMLNPVYLFRSFADLEVKYSSFESGRLMSDGYDKLGKLNLQYDKLKASGGNTVEENRLKDEFIQTCKMIADAIDNQINLIVAIQERIRSEYQKLML